MIKQATVIICILCSISAKSQFFGVRMGTSAGIQMSIPLNRAQLSMIVSKEDDRKLAYLHYTEAAKYKSFAFFGGVGIHAGSRYVLRYKQDANTIFLAGFTAIGGIRYSYKKIMLQADILPRADLPVFGGCEEHRYCSESAMNYNFSININL